MILNQRRWQSLSGQHGKGVDGLFEQVSFQTAFEGVESGFVCRHSIRMRRITVFRMKIEQNSYVIVKFYAILRVLTIYANYAKNI